MCVCHVHKLVMCNPIFRPTNLATRLSSSSLSQGLWTREMYLSDIQSARVEVLGLFSASLTHGGGGVGDEGNSLYQSIDTTGVGG